MKSPTLHDNIGSDFFELEKLAQEICQLRKENLALRMELETFRIKVIQARKAAELDSKYAKRLRNYFKRGAK